MTGPGQHGDYRFYGGPIDGEVYPTDGQHAFYIPVTEGPGLENLLRASLEVIEKKVTAVPDVTYRVAVYVMKRRAPINDKVTPLEQWAYVFDRWEED